MMVSGLRATIVYELRRHLGRWPFFAALAAIVWLTTTFWVDPASGQAMLAVSQARVRYDTAVMAIMFASNVMVFIGGAGFYLVRGNPQREWVSGYGSVIAALPVSSASLLFGRWLAALASMSLLALASLLTVLALHGLHVQAPIDLAGYLQTWVLMALPGMVFAASAAVCCDAWAPLTGRLGDALFFVLWMGSAFAMSAHWRLGGAVGMPLLLIDLPGHYSLLAQLAHVFGNSQIGGGRTSFDPAIAVLAMPARFWTARMVLGRLGGAALGLLPLWLALARFHRYSPDRLKPRKLTRARGVLGLLTHLNAPLQLLNRLAWPFAYLLRPLNGAARWPGLPGQVAAELRVALLDNPVAVAAMLVCWLIGAASDGPALGLALQPALIVWALLISNVSTRDYQGGWGEMSASLPGGAGLRFARQVGASLLLGVLFCAGVLLQWVGGNGVGLAAFFSGLLLWTVVATLIGQWTRLPRYFLALFLLALKVSDELRDIAVLDTFGIVGAATPGLAGCQLVAAIALYVGAQCWLFGGTANVRSLSKNR